MKGLLTVTVCLVLTAALGAPAPEAASSKKSASVLEGAKELEKPLTYSETKIPLGELVQKVADDTGAQLSAAREVADEPVAVVVKQCPARELLEELADLLDYRWSQHPGPRTPSARHRTPIYEIWQDLASKQREEALREGALGEKVAGLKGLQQDVRQLGRVARLSKDELRAALDAEHRQQAMLEKLTPQQRAAYKATPQEEEAFQRASSAYQLWSPISRATGLLLGRLTPAQWALLTQDGQLTFSTRPQPGELPLPTAIEQTFRSSHPEQTPRELIPFNRPPEPLPTPDQIAGREAVEERLREQWAGAADYQVTLSLRGDPTKREPLVLSAAAWPVRNADANGALGAFQPIGARVTLAANMPQGSGLPDAVGAAQREQLLKDPLFGAKNDVHALFSAAPAAEAPDGQKQVSLLDLLPALSKAYGVQFISDSYWYFRATIPSALLQQPNVPRCLLDFLDQAGSWDRKGNLIRLRNPFWFYARPREVPLRYVRRWRPLLDQRGALTLSEYLQLPSLLTEPQWGGLQDAAQAGALPQDMSDVYPSRWALRLYTALPAQQQQALWRGQAIPATAMPAAGQSGFLAALRGAARDRAGLRPRPQARLDALQLSVTQEPLARAVHTRPVQVTAVWFHLQYAPGAGEIAYLPVAAAEPP